MCILVNDPNKRDIRDVRIKNHARLAGYITTNKGGEYIYCDYYNDTNYTAKVLDAISGELKRLNKENKIGDAK